MKNAILFTFLMSWAIVGVAQELPKNAEGKIEYTEVMEVSGKSADELFENAKQWALATEHKKKEEAAADHKIVFTGAIPVNYPSVKKGGFDDGFVNYEVAIFCKDGRYKYRVFNLKHVGEHENGGALENYRPKCGTAYLLQTSWGKIKKDAALAMEKRIKTMKDRMRGLTGGSLDDKNDNW